MHFLVKDQTVGFGTICENLHSWVSRTLSTNLSKQRLSKHILKPCGEAMVQWLRQMAHDREVVGSTPITVYWMDVINLLAITLKKNLKSRKPSGAHQKINKIKKLILKPTNLVVIQKMRKREPKSYFLFSFLHFNFTQLFQFPRVSCRKHKQKHFQEKT